MKKSLILGILGLAAGAASSYGQGYIALDNYFSHGGSGGPLVTYAAGVPANGVSGAVGSGGLNSSWTVGIYFVQGTVSISDSAGTGLPNGALALGTGTGSTVQFVTTSFGSAGEFSSPSYFNTGGTFVAGDTVTAEMVAYLTSAGSYANSTAFRGHSAPFTMPTVAFTATTPTYTGDFFSGFSVAPVPEPATLTLAGLGGLASLVMLRRKKA